MRRNVVWIVIGSIAAATSWAQDPQTDTVRQAMFDAANGLVGTVQGGRPSVTMTGVDRAASLLLSLDSDQRENWQYWPTVRVGLPLEDMTAKQRRLTHDLLRAALSSNGYLKAVHIMQLEQILDMLDEGGLPRSVDHYKLVFFGMPSMTDAWAWRFEGHHVSLNIAVSPDGVGVTPSFLGSNPAEVVSGPLAGFRVHGVAEDLARGLLSSLSPEHRAQAVLSDMAPGEIFTGNIRKERAQWDAWIESLQPQGVAVGELNEVQQHWVRRILDEVVGNYRPEISQAYLDAIDVADLRFAWMGAAERRTPHYFRLQGPDFVFEYDNVQNNGNHVHSVWRSKSGDFGMGLLEEHYRTSHLRDTSNR